MKSIFILVLSASLLLMVGCKTTVDTVGTKPSTDKEATTVTTTKEPADAAIAVAEAAEAAVEATAEDFAEKGSATPGMDGTPTEYGGEATTVEEPAAKEEELNDFGMPSMLEFDEQFKHLGEVRRGEVRKLTFKYKNKTKEVVEIELVTACSCTTSDFSPKILQPGEEGRINLIFDSQNKHESETIDVDVILVNTDPVYDYPIVERVQFDFELKK